jgi:murein DD-endopeptidase MepM/ murein hydrolase activator NlpD
LEQKFIPTTKILNLKYRVGNIYHKFLRHIFEHKTTKKLLGANIALAILGTSFIPQNYIKDTTLVQDGEMASISSETPIHTTIGSQFPVENISISQGYRFFHPGIDLDGVTGDVIRPIKNGIVEKIEYSRIGYGNHVIVNHGNGLESLYAHLSKVDVAEGQNVTTDMKLGEMGATGRSSGDHLHLEIRDHGAPINPLSVLPW